MCYHEILVVHDITTSLTTILGVVITPLRLLCLLLLQILLVARVVGSLAGVGDGVRRYALAGRVPCATY